MGIRGTLMKIGVFGLWHLGCVTAGCLATVGHNVIACDPDENIISNLNKNKPPLFEPGLEELLKEDVGSGKLEYTNKIQDLAGNDIVWITFDTPVDENDNADVDLVVKQICNILPVLSDGTLVLISSQLPVGSIQKIKQDHLNKYADKNITFACSPENLRLGQAIDIFMHPDRIVVGYESENDKDKIQRMFKDISTNIIWMSVESAEMTKHALNAFLATSVVFINELATICELVGADASEVEKGLKSEMRIGEKAYLHPGDAFAGGTLARDVTYLTKIGKQKSLPVKLFPAILESNQTHKQWAFRRVKEVLQNLRNKTIAILGLTYKPGTNTLRRSAAIETCHLLHQAGTKITAYDPAIGQLEDNSYKFIDLKLTINDALQGADAVIVATPCPEFVELSSSAILQNMRQPIVFDVNGFLSKNLADNEKIRYFPAGKAV